MAAPKQDTLVYLDIEIGDQELKSTSWDLYRRGQAFFATHGSLYGYDGQILEDLGPEDRQNLQEIYDSNPVLTKGGNITLNEPAPLPGGRLVIQLDTEGCPKTSDNFLAFCECRYTNKVQEATYVNSRLFRLVKDHILQGGDFTKNDGSGGFSSYPSIENPKPFADEKAGLLKKKFTKPGVLAMANRGKNTNGSQFFFTLGQGAKWAKTLDGNYVAFGQVLDSSDPHYKTTSSSSTTTASSSSSKSTASVRTPSSSSSDDICVDGLGLLEKLNKIPTDADERPIQAITVIGCGRVVPLSSS
ncbi:pre-mRNA-splicing factor syf2 [Podila humilis]|nr:pre-mRNA-splicing factor syf2 [Podila humilis]